MRHVFLEKGFVTLKEVCEPILADNTVLVSVSYSCISPGTEGSAIAHAQHNVLTQLPAKLPKLVSTLAQHGFEGTKALIKEKLSGNLQSLGYSCSGKVIAVGKNIKRFKVGDLVTCAGAGYAHHADIVAVPEQLVTLVSHEDYLKKASMTTLGAIALQGVRRAQLQLGETVCVIGLGLLGQLTVQLAKLSGCNVIGIDLLPERLTLAKALGADKTFAAMNQDIENEIAFMTLQHGVDTTLITAGSSSNTIIQQAMRVTRKKGRVVVVGDVGLHLERNPLYHKEIDFLISCSYGPGRYDTAYEQEGVDYPYAYVRWTENRNMQAFMELIEKGRINLDPLISETVHINDVSNAYERLKEQQALSIILAYNHDKPESVSDKAVDQPQSYIAFKPAYKEKLRLAVVGAGGFAKVKLLPIIAKLKSIKINAIVDTNATNSLQTSKVYGAARALTNETELFKEDLVDAVLIASPHKYHCTQALAALRNGKAVFLEKPMVTNVEQLEEFKKFFKEQETVPFCVDYNRSFAPFIKKIKKVVADRISPLVMHYRMNAGFIPKDHWIQSEIGAGRIIGEACHIFDLFCFLTDAYPTSVSVETIRPRGNDLFPTDNFTVQFSFSDGSIAHLVYTALGHKDVSKERMELFFDSKAIVMDDYKLLQGYGLPKSFNENMMVPDKGHEHLLKTFFQELTTQERIMPISLERLQKVAEITLCVDKLACQGGGEASL